jgi:hypothetical protein
LVGLAASALVVLSAGCGHHTAPDADAAAPSTSAAAAAATAAPTTDAQADRTPNWTCHGVDEKPPPMLHFANGQRDGIIEGDLDNVPGGPVYGDPEAATRYWEQQTQSDCGLMATRMVIGEMTGAPPTEQEMIALATTTPSECSVGQRVYDDSPDPSDGGVGHGTCTNDLLLLLKHFGIDATYTDDDASADGGAGTGLKALKEYLGDGRHAMVCVNSHTIWDDDGDRTQCGHMVTVAAIDVDADLVYLGDSGGEDTRGETVSIDTFEKAWKTGDHELVITN